jgi:hypothetical protein
VVLIGTKGLVEPEPKRDALGGGNEFAGGYVAGLFGC